MPSLIFLALFFYKGGSLILGQSNMYTPGDIELGGLFSAHYKGNSRSCGEFYTSELRRIAAMVFAVEQVNKNPILLPNLTLGYYIYDYCSNSALAAQAAYKFVTESDPRCQSVDYKSKQVGKHRMVIIGPTDSASALLVAPLLNLKRITMISPTATSPELSATGYDNFLRTIPSDKWRAHAMADLIEEFHWKYIAVVALDDSFGRNGFWALEKESLSRNTFCIGFYAYIPRLDYSTKIQDTVSQLGRRSEIKVVVIWLWGEYHFGFLTEAVHQKLQGRTWLMSIPVTANEATHIDPEGLTLSGTLAVSPHNYPDTVIAKNISDDGISSFEEFLKASPSCNSEAGALNNSCGFNLFADSENTHFSFVSNAVFAAAHAFHKLGRTYGWSFRAGSDNNLTTMNEDFQKVLRDISFTETTGTFTFDTFGDPKYVLFDISNLQRNSETKSYVQKIVGVWERGKKKPLQLNMSLVKWNSGQKSSEIPQSVCSEECPPGTRKVPNLPCCWDCIRCPPGYSTQGGSTNCTKCLRGQKSAANRTKCVDLPLKNVSWKSAFGIVVILLSATGIFMTSLVLAIFIYYWNTPIIKASCRELSCPLLLGIAAVFMLSVLHLPLPTDFLCCSIQYLRYLAYTSCVSILLVKTLRILNAFSLNMNSPNRHQRNKWAQCAILITLLAIENVLSLLWILMDPPRKHDSIRQAEYIFITCQLYSSSVGLWFVAAVSIYVILLSIFCAVYAFRAKNLPDNFNEAKYIAFSLYIMLLSAAAYHPVELALDGWYVSVVACVTSICSSFGLLGCIFGPKVYLILFRAEKNTSEVLRMSISQFTFGNRSPSAEQ